MKRLLVSSLILGAFSLPAFADSTNAKVKAVGVAKITNIVDRNGLILDVPADLYKGLDLTFEVKLNTEYADNVSYYNRDVGEVYHSRRGEEVPYDGWSTKTVTSNSGTDHSLSSYDTTFSTMKITLPSITTGVEIIPSRSFSHRQISNPSAIKITESLTKEADYGTYQIDKISLTSSHQIDLPGDDGEYLLNSHKLALGGKYLQIFDSGSLLEHFEYSGDHSTALSNFTSKEMKVDISEMEELNVTFQVKSLEWVPQVSCE